MKTRKKCVMRGFGECEICVAGIYERGGSTYIYNPPQRKEGGWGWKNIQRLAKIESRDVVRAADRDFSIAPSCVWQVVERFICDGLYVIFKKERIDERGWKQKFGFMFISEEIG